MDRRIRGAALACALLTTGLATGCTAGSPKDSRATEPSRTASPTPTVRGDVAARTAVEAAYRRWSLKPLPAPPAPPAAKPVRLRAGAGQVPVINEIPTKEKIVFLTFDDGAEKDPEFVRMMRELKIPFTMFLTDAAIRSDYGYRDSFAVLRPSGRG